MKDDKFKKLIQSIDLEEPGAAFTDNIMKMVQAQEELNLKPALLAAIKQELVAEPSVGFTENLMAQIQPAASKAPEAVMTPKVKLIVSGVFIALLLVALVNSRYTLGHLQNSSYFSGLSLNFAGTAIGVVKIAGSVLLYLIPLSVLLLVDYFFRTRRQQLTP
nr:hypothetical protein [uncultured Mucilaginibacter sp.]